jgi:hypothetical protein
MKIEGYRMAMPNDTSIDIHLVSEDYTKNHDDRLALSPAAGGEGDTGESTEAKTLKPREYTVELAGVNSDVIYGPWKNIFYSCYFILTGVHALHVVGGMIPITILLVQSLRGRILPANTEYVGLYWHFVDLVWIFLFPLLYLI